MSNRDKYGWSFLSNTAELTVEIIYKIFNPRYRRKFEYQITANQIPFLEGSDKWVNLSGCKERNSCSFRPKYSQFQSNRRYRCTIRSIENCALPESHPIFKKELLTVLIT